MRPLGPADGLGGIRDGPLVVASAALIVGVIIVAGASDGLVR